MPIVLMTYFLFLIPVFIVLGLIAYFARKLSYRNYLLLLTFSAALLSTPLPGPWGMPIPFGYAVVFSIATLEFRSLVQQLQAYSAWLIIAFPVTLLVSFAIIRWLIPNYAIKVTAE